MAKRQRRRRQERRQEHAKRDGWKTRHSMISGAGLAAGATLALASPAVAAPLYLTVNQSGDAGDGTCDATCTLRDAVDDANANANANEFDYIYFSGSISGSVLTAGQISVTDGVGFYGNGPGATTISGGNSSRIFYLNPGYDYSVNFNNLTLANGNAGAGKGGAISNVDANLNIFGSALTGNTAADGGAIYDSGQDYSGYNIDVVASNDQRQPCRRRRGRLLRLRHSRADLCLDVQREHRGGSGRRPLHELHLRLWRDLRQHALGQ